MTVPTSVPNESSPPTALSLRGTNIAGENIQSCSDHEIIRAMITAENELINQRISWLMMVQGLLFTTLGLLWGKEDVIPLLWILSVMGTFIALIVLFPLTCATKAMMAQYDWWEEHKPVDYRGPNVIGSRQPDKPFWRMVNHYVGPWSFFPIVFIFAWFAIWWIKLR
jgi:hypothetical protein